jgi:hypothetical protein
MPVLFFNLADRAICLIAALAFAENLFEEWQQGRISGALLAAAMIAAFLPGLVYGEPLLRHVTERWPLILGKAVAAILAYACFQGFLNEWQHDRLGGAGIAALLTAAFTAVFYYGRSSFGFGRQAPWDVWREKRRLARIDRWRERQERNRHL